MANVEIGERVMAISHSENGTTYVFGNGIFLGDKEPNDDVVIMGMPFAEIKDQMVGFTNPAILLDSGQVVFGCECWWGSEEKMKIKLEGQKIEMVDIVKSRKRIMDKIEEA